MRLLVQERGGGGVVSGRGPKVHGVGAEPVSNGLPTVHHSACIPGPTMLEHSVWGHSSLLPWRCNLGLAGRGLAS
jgi:hypothetical protein